MKIRLAKEQDFPRIMDIYAYARRFMAENGNPRQWARNNWPPESLIHQDIERKKSYLCVNDEDYPIAVFFFTQGNHAEPGYDHIEEGAWLGTDDYGVVHRIATDGSQKGIGAFCLNWAFAECGHLRIDTHPDNKPMQGLLKKLGFTQCGIIHVEEDNDPRFAFEKLS